MEDGGKIKVMASQGLTKAEAEGLLDRKLSEEEKRLFDGTKAAIKLQKAQPPAVQDPPPERALSIKERYADEQVLQVIRRCNGRKAAMVKALDCSYSQLRVWFEHHKEARELADRLREAFVDEAEEQVWLLMNSRDERVRADMAKFVLRTLGKGRGWAESAPPQFQQQITADDRKIQIMNIFGVPADENPELSAPPAEGERK